MGNIESVRVQPKSERILFEDKEGNIKYHDHCLGCTKDCKQSYMVSKVICSVRIKAHTPKQYISEIIKQKKDLDTIGREIGLNSRTVKSMLYERQDMTKELYVKLEKLLYNKDLSK